MSFLHARRIALGAAALLAAACQSVAPEAAPPGVDGGGPEGESQVALSFDASTAACAMGAGICTQPGASLQLGLTLGGGPDRAITVWLEGSYGDASLSAGQVTTSGGQASVALQTGTTAPATFYVHASATGAMDALLFVSVSADGFTDVTVVASYSGVRPQQAVTASAFLGTTCAALAMATLGDGSPVASGALGAPIVLNAVPAGGHVSIQARIDFYAAGCVDIAELTPNGVPEVDVSIIDVPMALAQTNLDALFTFTPAASDALSWTNALDADVSPIVSTFAPSNGEPGALLDAMRALVPAADQASFDAARSQGEWDDATASWLGQHSPTMGARITSWLEEGEPDTLGALAAHLDPGASAGFAAISLLDFTLANTNADVSASSAGLSVSGPFAWTADAQDTVHLSGTLTVSAPPLLARAADARAVKDVQGAPPDQGVAGALATTIDCDGLGAALAGSSMVYPGCDATCLGALCGAALSSMWATATSTGGGSLSIGMTASAPATVDDHAAPVSFDGSWVGQVGPTSGGPTFDTKGEAKAAQGLVPR